MNGEPVKNVTLILNAIRDGEGYRTHELLDIVYSELKRIAVSQLGKEHGACATVSPSSLVHQAYLRLVSAGTEWESRRHFFAAAAQAMRRILVEEARRQAAQKHGGGWTRIPMRDAAERVLQHRSGKAADPGTVDVLALNDALSELEGHDPRMAEVVMLRFFTGLTLEDTARALDVTVKTVQRDWNDARTWLHMRLAGAGGREARDVEPGSD